MILDCETYNSTLKSVSRIYNSTTQQVEAYLESINSTDIDFLIKECPNVSVSKANLKLFESKIGRDPSNLTQVNWFHLTRAFDASNFTKGILPVNDVIESIWINLINNKPDKATNLRQLKDGDQLDPLYWDRIEDISLVGPYGFLVREVSIYTMNIGYHSFLKMPEIIDYICRGYKNLFGYDITEEVKNLLTPIIVKFRSQKILSKDCIESAVFYLYLKIKRKELNDYASTNFNGRNSAIPAKDVLKCETQTI